MTDVTTTILRVIEAGALKPEEARWVHARLIEQGEEPAINLCEALVRRNEHLSHTAAADALADARSAGYPD